MSRDLGRVLAWVLLLLNVAIPLLIDPASVDAYHFGPATIRSLSIVAALIGFALNGLPTAWKSQA